MSLREYLPQSKYPRTSRKSIDSHNRRNGVNTSRELLTPSPSSPITKTSLTSRIPINCPDNRPDGHYSYRILIFNGRSPLEPKWPQQMCYPDVIMWTPPWTTKRRQFVQNQSLSKHLILLLPKKSDPLLNRIP